MQQSIKSMGEKNNDLTEIIAQALNEMKRDLGDRFDPSNVNLAELGRRTGISRAKLRRINLRSREFIPRLRYKSC
jgi:hypothetical protein